MSEKSGSYGLFCKCPDCGKEIVYEDGMYRYIEVKCPICGSYFPSYECCVERPCEQKTVVASGDYREEVAREMLARASTLPLDSKLRQDWLLLEVMFKAKTREYSQSSHEKKQEAREDWLRFLRPFKEKWGFPENVYKLYVDHCLQEGKLLYITEFIREMPKLADEHPQHAQSIYDYVLKKARE